MVTPVKRGAVAHLKTSHESERRRDRLPADDGALSLLAPGRSGLARTLASPGTGTPAVRLPPASDLPASGGFTMNHKRLLRI